MMKKISIYLINDEASNTMKAVFLQVENTRTK